MLVAMPRRAHLVITTFLFVVVLLTLGLHNSDSYRPKQNANPLQFSSNPLLQAGLSPDLISEIQQLIDSPLGDGEFGKMGQRVQLLNGFIQVAETASDNGVRAAHVESLILSMFPWLQHPSKKDSTPLRSLRQSLGRNSRGIVIPVGTKQFRFAAHLITCLRDVLKSTLPIQVAFAGEADLPSEYQQALVSLGKDVSLLDVTALLNNDILQLQGSWAIKPFAVLASAFAEVILIDADAVLLLDPAVLFTYPAYGQTGTYFFHDRLLWQNVFKERQRWWEQEMSFGVRTAAILKSLVYTQGYAEEQDSGIVVLDKQRLEVLTALLHTCWQNTKPVRDSYTYRIMYGEKESWWLGLELCGVEYAFEENYGSIAGLQVGEKVCSFTIAHPDALDPQRKLLWYNGSLLKNKARNATEYLVPTVWMTNGTWEKGASKPDMSCMRDAALSPVLESQIQVAERSVEAAKLVDVKFSKLISDSDL